MSGQGVYGSHCDGDLERVELAALVEESGGGVVDGGFGGAVLADGGLALVGGDLAVAEHVVVASVHVCFLF